MSDQVKIVTQAIYMFVFIDDILKSIGHRRDKRAQCQDSEIITTALIAALHYGGNHADAIGFVKQTGLMPGMLSESRFKPPLASISGFKRAIIFSIRSSHYVFRSKLDLSGGQLSGEMLS